jgi:hypothetical protein
MTMRLARWQGVFAQSGCRAHASSLELARNELVVEGKNALNSVKAEGNFRASGC